MFKNLLGNLRKLLPTLLLVGLAVIAGATNLLGSNVQEMVSSVFQEYGRKILPFAVQLLVGGVALNLAYLLYHPLRNGLSKALQKTGASDRGKNLAVKALQLIYWGGACFFVAAIIAPDMLSKFFLGISLLGAALTLAMQGAANDFICGVLLQFAPKFKEGEEISLVGLDVKGKVKDIGYLSTRVQSADGLIVAPNREVWARAVKVVMPPKPQSQLILPSGSTPEKK